MPAHFRLDPTNHISSKNVQNGILNVVDLYLIWQKVKMKNFWQLSQRQIHFHLFSATKILLDLLNILIRKRMMIIFMTSLLVIMNKVRNYLTVVSYYGHFCPRLRMRTFWGLTCSLKSKSWKVRNQLEMMKLKNGHSSWTLFDVVGKVHWRWKVPKTF